MNKCGLEIMSDNANQSIIIHYITHTRIVRAVRISHIVMFIYIHTFSAHSFLFFVQNQTSFLSFAFLLFFFSCWSNPKPACFVCRPGKRGGKLIQNVR